EDSGESTTKRSNFSSSDVLQDRKEFLHRFVDREILSEHLASWFDEIANNAESFSAFSAPFELIDLQKFEYALEGTRFLQLVRMPNTIYASTSSSVESTAYLALEDFLQASATSLWEAFWGHECDPTPFFVSSLYDGNWHFYRAEKAISKGKLEGLCGSALLLKNPRHPQAKWDDVIQLALLKPDVGSLISVEDDSKPPFRVIGEALFFAFRVLLARSISKSDIPMSLHSVFLILVDSQNGCVVKVEGDVNKLELHLNNVYKSAAAWYKSHSKVAISPVDRIWNRLGNANWNDVGALQLLYATFHSLVQYAGFPKNSIEDLAAEHSSRLQMRQYERKLGDKASNSNGMLHFQHRSVQSEIVEVQEDYPNSEKKVTLEMGNVVLIQDSSWQQEYQIGDVLTDGDITFYVALPVEDPGKPVYLHVGSLTSQLEPPWEDMDSWYEVQRQTKVLTAMKQKGVSSKHLPQLIASGRVVHPGKCSKSSSSHNCDHPWCGAPVLLTGPVGRTVADMVKLREFGADEAIRCCHDCLSALSSSSSAGIRHGNIRPEDVVCLKSDSRQQQHPYYVLTGWGRAILEEPRDRPTLNLHYSSTSALQEGRLCSASDVESLVYMLYFSIGGDFPLLDSVEGALQWREISWSRRLIQQKLGDISAVLKAFADYVDSLCGTPYPVDYEIWIRRLKRHIHDEDNGKKVNASS
ncbi:hypothetical protein M569_10531, partial [Genlisea aurea]